MNYGTVSAMFDPHCRLCPRLARHLKGVKRDYPGYFSAPVPAFGDPDARLLVVGLAPGLHGANATGRPFTGDFAGILLYQTLHRFGYASAAESVNLSDGLTLTDCRISNAVKCLPPENKPTGDEINTCNRFLRHEIASSEAVEVIVALGTIAHNAVLKAYQVTLSAYPFGHAQEHRLPDGRLLIDSYHCSRYNTQTGRLTEAMFEQVFTKVRRRLDAPQVPVQARNDGVVTV